MRLLKKAYSTVEVLLAVFILGFVIVVSTQFQKGLMRSIQIYDVEKQLSLNKLQLILAKATIYNIEPNEIELRYENEPIKIILHNQRLVKTPGYHILFDNIEGQFNVSNDCLYINDWKIYCEKGIR